MDWIISYMGLTLCKFLNLVGANSIGRHLNCNICVDSQVAMPTTNDPQTNALIDMLTDGAFDNCLNAGWVTLIFAVFVIPVVLLRLRSN